MLKKEYGKTRKSLATARLFRVHLFCTHDMSRENEKMILQDVDEDLNPQKVGGAAEAL